MSVNTTSFDFSSLELSSAKPISIPMETVEVSISSTDMIDSYAKAFCAEARRKNPLRAEQINLTDDEVTQYADYLITKRVECVHNECHDARKLKVLYIPSYLQFVLETIGIYQDRTYGLKLVPVMEEKSEMTFEEALKVSEKIGSFIDDLQIVQDAMPRENVGHEGVMATALIAGYMRSYKTSVKPVDTYVAAFLKLQLVKEQSFAALYRIQYDDYDFIEAALTSCKGLF